MIQILIAIKYWNKTKIFITTIKINNNRLYNNKIKIKINNNNYKFRFRFNNNNNYKFKFSNYSR